MRLWLLASHRRRVKIATAVVLVVLAVGATVGTLLVPDNQLAAVATADSTSTVRRGTVALSASAAGTVQAATTRGLSFSANGTVTQLNVKAGDPVTAGQVLASIDDTDAQSAVDGAQSSVNSAQDALTSAENTASPSAAAGSCQAAPAAYVWPSPATNASTVAPTSTAVPTPTAIPSPTVAPTPTASPSGTQPNGGAAAGGGADTCGTSSGGGTTGSAGRGGSADTLMVAQQQLNDAQLALARAQQKLAGTVITAPLAGTVLSVSGTVGGAETVSGTGFIVLSGLNDTQVTAYFTEADVAHLAVGQTTSIMLPDGTGQTYTGKVSQVSLVGTTDNKLVRYTVMIVFDQAPSGLLYGQSANVVVTVSSISDVLYVSSSAVTDINDGSGTVTVRIDGHDERRTVQVGLRGDQYTEVTSGLSQGDTVVLAGQ